MTPDVTTVTARARRAARPVRRAALQAAVSRATRSLRCCWRRRGHLGLLLGPDRWRLRHAAQPVEPAAADVDHRHARVRHGVRHHRGRNRSVGRLAARFARRRGRDPRRHAPLAARVDVAGRDAARRRGWRSSTAGWSTYRRVPSFIVGLGGMLAYRGVLLGITGGSTIAPVSDNLVFIGQGYLPRIAGDALAVVLFVLLAVLTVRQRSNRQRYSLPVVPMWQDGVKIVARGRDPGWRSSRRSTVTAAFRCPCCCCSRCLAFSRASRRRPCSDDASMRSDRISKRRAFRRQHESREARDLRADGSDVRVRRHRQYGAACGGFAVGRPMGELDAIAACFIGGTSMRGGSGTVYGALIGALVMASLDNGMSMLDVDAYWQMIVKGHSRAGRVDRRGVGLEPAVRRVTNSRASRHRTRRFRRER